METENTTEVKKPIPSDVERKRETISFQVSPKEKTQITYMAIKDCGISVSEFIRTKIFLEPKKAEPIEPLLPNPMDDEERAIYEGKLKEITDENAILKNQIVKDKVLKSEIIEDAGTTEIKDIVTDNINDLVIKLEPELKQLVDRIKQFREDKFKTLDIEEQKSFYDLNKFLKLILFRGFRRSYSLSELKASTGLVLSEIESISESEGIDNWNI